MTSHFILGNVTFSPMFRHKKNREAAVELLMKLKDNRDLQKFLQDCQEVSDSFTKQLSISQFKIYS